MAMRVARVALAGTGALAVAAASQLDNDSPVVGKIYSSAVKPMLMLLDPETAHRVAVKVRRLAERSKLHLIVAAAAGAFTFHLFLFPCTRSVLKQELVKSCAFRTQAASLKILPAQKREDDPVLRTTLWGRTVRNPIGLAAGFDKDAEAIDGLFRVGFGLVEVASANYLLSGLTIRPLSLSCVCNVLSRPFFAPLKADISAPAPHLLALAPVCVCTNTCARCSKARARVAKSATLRQREHCVGRQSHLCFVALVDTARLDVAGCGRARQHAERSSGAGTHGLVCEQAFEAGHSPVESVGSITPLPQPGNPKPRVFRLPEDDAVINRHDSSCLPLPEKQKSNFPPFKVPT
eukprot:6205361-Pleurochrysis_carterae.AAC.1